MKISQSLTEKCTCCCNANNFSFQLGVTATSHKIDIHIRYKRLQRTFDKMSKENTSNNLKLPVKASWMEGKKIKLLLDPYIVKTSLTPLIAPASKSRWIFSGLGMLFDEMQFM